MIKNRLPFYFIRHGETDYNRAGVFVGSLDVPLNALGREQAFAAAKLMRQYHFKTIVSSPLKRAFETASIIGQHVGIEPVMMNELSECSFGLMEGKPHLSSTWQEYYTAWREGYTYEQAEAHKDFMARVVTGVEQSLIFEGPVLVVAHGAVGTALVDAIGLPHYGFDNAQPHSFEPHDAHERAWRVQKLVKQDFDELA